MPKLVAFDLDDTLAPSKSPLLVPMARGLAALLARTSVCVISGGNYGQFERQVITPLASLRPEDARRMHLMPTCGTQYFRSVDGVWTQIYSEPLSESEIRHASASLERRARELGFWKPVVWGDRIEDRQSQVTFSALGQLAPAEAKAAWDPSGKRKETLRIAVAADLTNLEVRSGGSTSIDVTRRGIDKAFGIGRLAQATGIAPQEMVFVGDRLQPGGNDYPVIATGVQTIETDGWQQTLQIMQRWF